MIIDSGLTEVIDLKRDQMVQNSDYWLKRNHHLRHALASSAKHYKWMIDHPEVKLHARGKSSSQDRGDCIMALQDGLSNFEAAWEFISHSDNFLSEDILLRVGGLIDPERNSKGYRQSRVSLNNSTYIPPNYIKVPERVESALKEISDDNIHPVERAAMAHLYLTGIQPFSSGNKRAGTLFQNRILYGSELPVAVVQPGEHETYITLLDRALMSWKRGTKAPRKDFYNFIAGKVNIALDNISYDLDRIKNSNGGR